MPPHRFAGRKARVARVYRWCVSELAVSNDVGRNSGRASLRQAHLVPAGLENQVISVASEVGPHLKGECSISMSISLSTARASCAT